METPVLWQFTSSHYNEKARWALDFKRVPHIRRSLVPGFHVRTVKAKTGQTAVPVLKLNGEVISDSTKIIAALEKAFPHPALYPADLEQRRRALELEMDAEALRTADETADQGFQILDQMEGDGSAKAR